MNHANKVLIDTLRMHEQSIAQLKKRLERLEADRTDMVGTLAELEAQAEELRHSLAMVPA